MHDAIKPKIQMLPLRYSHTQTRKAKRPTFEGGAFYFVRSLTMTYFHIRLYTIIGAKSFHCPVRDGKEWDQLAMVVRHNWCSEDR